MMLLTLGWYFILLVLALIGVPLLTVCVAFVIPTVAIVLVVLAYVDPVVVAAVGRFNYGKEILEWISLDIALQYMVAIYLFLIPVTNSRSKVLVLGLAILAVIFLSFIIRGNLEAFAKKMRKWMIITIGLITLMFVFPESTEFVGQLFGWVDKKVAADGREATGIRSSSLIPPGGTLETPEEMAEFNASLPKTKSPAVARAPEKRDLISFPTKLTKGVWSTEVDLFSLNPFRYHWDLSVSDSVLVGFSNRTELVVHPGDTLRVGNRPAVMSFLAFNEGTVVIPSAWNQ